MKNTKINRPAPVMGRNITTALPIIAEGRLEPEFAGHAKIRELFDLSRTHLHRLSTNGKIRSVCLRERGKLRGRRLYDVESVRALLIANLDMEVAN
jgi:hypothetical protein